MKEIFFEYWGGLTPVKYVNKLPRGKARYLCTDYDRNIGTDVDYYDVNEDYIIGVTENA